MNTKGFNKFRSFYFTKKNYIKNDFLNQNFKDFSDKNIFTIFRDDTNFVEKKEISKHYGKLKFRDFEAGAFGNVFPKTPADILKFPIPKRKGRDLQKMINSYLFIFQENELFLEQFLCLKKKFEKFFEDKNYTEACICLEDARKDLGYSLWLLDCYKKIPNEIHDDEWKRIFKGFYEEKGFLRGQLISYLENRGQGGASYLSYVTQLCSV